MNSSNAGSPRQRRDRRAVGLQRGQQRADAGGRRQQRADRVDDQREAELGDPLQRQRGSPAALGPVEDQRRDAARARSATRSMSSSDVGASTNSTSAPASAKARARAMASSIPVTATASVRAMISRSGSRRASTAARSLPDHLVGADQQLAAHVPALLGHHLVLELDPGDAGLLVELHGADDVDRVAVAGVGVGDDRHVDGGDDPAGVVDHLRAASAARRRGGRSARPSSRSRSCRRRRSRPARSAGRSARRRRPGRPAARTRRPARAAGPAVCVRRSADPPRRPPLVCSHAEFTPNALPPGTERP